MIHSPRTIKHQSHVKFWRYQATIKDRLRSQRGLHSLIIQVHAASTKKLTEEFIKTLIYDGWLLTPVNAQYLSFGDSINSSSVVILGIHSSTEEKVSHLHLPNPTTTEIRYITDYIVKYFNKENYILSWAKDSPFLDEHYSTLRIIPSDRKVEEFAHCNYYLARKSDNSNITCGCGVYHTSCLAPPLDEENTNMFARSFVIESEISIDGNNQRSVRPISSYEHNIMFNLTEKSSLKLEKLHFFHLLDAGIPGNTSVLLINCVYERLISIRKNSLDDPR